MACHPSLALRGRWNLSDTLVRSDPAYCPNAFGVFTRDRHGAQYVCRDDHTYWDANYVWDVPPPGPHALVDGLLASGPMTVAFVGDSTLQQVFYATACELERADALDVSRWSAQHEEYRKTETIDQPDGISLTFAFSRFLRADLPCAPWCVNATVEACGACADDGAPRAPALDARLLDALERRPDALVLGVGSWYNYHKGLYDSNAEFHRTLHLLRDELAAAGARAFWYDIPNCGAACDRARRPEPAYEWEGIAGKNDVARRTLGGAVHYLNVSGAVQPRLAADRVWPDGGPTDGMPHYCNPGRSSIPQFVAHVLLMLLSACTRHLTS